MILDWSGSVSNLLLSFPSSESLVVRSLSPASQTMVADAGAGAGAAGPSTSTSANTNRGDVPGASSSFQSPLDESSYWSSRSSLLSKESSLRYDHHKLSSLSPLEVQADAVLRQARRADVADRWSREDDLSRYPGMPFHLALSKGLTQSRVFRLLQKMPKGNLLHSHTDGMVKGHWLVDRALDFGEVLFIKSDRPILSMSDLYQAEVQIAPRSLKDRDSRSIFTAESHDSEGWMSLKDAAKAFHLLDVYAEPGKGRTEAYGSSTSSSLPPSELAFRSWLHSLITLSPCSHAPPTTSSPQAWSRFGSTFAVINGIFTYVPIFREYIKEMVVSHARDGIQYIETRMNFLEEFFVDADGETQLPHRKWVEILLEAVEEAKLSLASEGIIFYDIKIIYATVRFIEPEKLQWYLNDCLDLAKSFPGRIVGFDLVGYEDPLKPLKEYVPQLLEFRRTTQELDLDLPLILHAGETITDGGPADENLYDALLLAAPRLGHAISLSKHPLLISLVKERHVCIESCPISNEVLGFTGSVAQHPSLWALLNQGVDVVLSNDDPTQFGNAGLSYDFHQFFVASQASSLASLYTLALNSIEHSRLTDKEREEQKKGWHAKWQQWCEWVVSVGAGTAAA